MIENNSIVTIIEVLIMVVIDVPVTMIVDHVSHVQLWGLLTHSDGSHIYT